MANRLTRSLSRSKIKEFADRHATVDEVAGTITAKLATVRKVVDRPTQKLLIARGNLTISG